MSLPNSVTIHEQMIDFSTNIVVILKISSPDIYYVYPLSGLKPLENITFFYNIENWFEQIEKANTELTPGSLTGWDKIEKSVVENFTRGLVLWYEGNKYFLPFITVSNGEDYPTSSIKMSLDFKQISLFREFEKDRLVAAKMMRGIILLNKRNVPWECKVDVKKFTDIYHELTSFSVDEIFPETIIYALDEEMKRRIDYLKDIKYVNDDNNTEILCEQQMNELSVYTCRKLMEIKTTEINSYLIDDKNHQCFIKNDNTYVVKKCSSEIDALKWLDKDRLHTLRKLTYERTEDVRYPSSKYQFFISSYKKFEDYENEFVEDIDGYKISLINYRHNVYIIIPIFVRYIKRKISNFDVVGNIVGVIGEGSYWNTENELYLDFSLIRFPSKIEISDVIKKKEYAALVTVDGSLWIIYDHASPVLVNSPRNIFKLVGGSTRIWLLTEDDELFYVSTEEKSSTSVMIDSSVSNVWAFNTSAVYGKTDNSILVWGSTKYLENTTSPFFDQPILSKKLSIKKFWKIFLQKFALSYQGNVYDLSKNTLLEIKFRKPILRIVESKGKLFALSKYLCFVRAGDGSINEIRSENGERITNIEENYRLTVVRKNEK